MPNQGQCCHDHDCADTDCGASYSLYQHVDLDRLTCLNEAEVPSFPVPQDLSCSELSSQIGSCRRVFKPWAQRTDLTGRTLPHMNAPLSHLLSVGEPLKSNEDDPELLLQIPFAGSVNLKAICVIGGVDGTAPSKMRAYINRDLDFDAVQDIPPLQEWELQEDLRGLLEYPTTASRFKGVHTLVLHFPEIFGAADHSEIFFIGLKGEFIEWRKEAVQAVYEAKPMPEDHQVPGNEQGNIWRTGM